MRLLPGDGVKAVEVICAERDVPVLFITGYRQELEDRKPDALSVQKPVNKDELSEALERLLKRRPLAF